MTEQPIEPSSEPTAAAETAPEDAPRRGSTLRRLGCFVGLLLWLLVMMIPCFFIALAVRPDIMVTTGSAPNQMLRFWLINEADHRGVGMSSATVHSGLQDGGLCVQTDVRFFLWIGQNDPTSYCECYAPVGGEMKLSGTTTGQCTP